mgnify:FL=1
MGLLASIISSINGGLISLLSLLVQILGIFVGTPGADPLFVQLMGNLNGAFTTVKEQYGLGSLVWSLFAFFIAINVVQEIIRYLAEVRISPEEIGFVRVIRETASVGAVIVIFMGLFFSKAAPGWNAATAVVKEAAALSGGAATVLVDSVADTASAISSKITLTGMQGIGAELLIMLMAFGMVFGMINCASQLLGNFVVALVGIVMGVIMLPIHIAMSLLGRIANPGRVALVLINALILCGVIIGLGNAIVHVNISDIITSGNIKTWQERIPLFMIYLGLLEAFKTLVQSANQYLTGLLTNIFQVG